MIEVNASIRSVEASISQYQESSERNAVALQLGGNKKASPLLSTQEKQIVDEVGISSAAVEQLEQARVINEQLKEYLDYLKGRDDDDGNVRITSNDNSPTAIVAAESTKLSASITVASYKEESLDISAKFDNSGNLQELSVEKTSITAEYIQADFSLENTQFFAAIA